MSSLEIILKKFLKFEKSMIFIKIILIKKVFLQESLETRKRKNASAIASASASRTRPVKLSDALGDIDAPQLMHPRYSVAANGGEGLKYLAAHAYLSI